MYPLEAETASSRAIGNVQTKESDIRREMGRMRHVSEMLEKLVDNYRSTLDPIARPETPAIAGGTELKGQNLSSPLAIEMAELNDRFYAAHRALQMLMNRLEI